MLFEQPKLACRSCDDCEKYEYDEDGDQVKEWDGKIELPVLRLPHNPPVCWACDKVPDKVRQLKQRHVTRADAINLTERNKLVYLHYRECRAVGVFPDDPIVRRHAGIIRDIQDNNDAYRIEKISTLLSVMRSK